MFSLLKKLNPFRAQPTMVVSMQITDELVRFVGLQKNNQGVFVYMFGEQYFSQGTMSEGKIIHPQVVVQALHHLKKKYHLENVHVVLPEEQSFVFQTTVTKGDSSSEIQAIIEDHIVSYLKLHTKLPVSDVVCEYDITGQRDDDYDVSVWATPRAIIDSYIQVFRQAELEPVSLEFGSHMVSRACLEDAGKETCLLVDFGNQKTHIAVAEEGIVVHSVTVPVGEAVLTPKIREFLNTSVAEAERIKKKYGLLRTHKEPALLSELFHELSPVRDYLDRLYITWQRDFAGKNPIKRVVLHGEGTGVAGLRDHISRATSIPTEYAHVWRKVTLPTDRAPEISFEDSLKYATVLSCALHAMNQHSE